MSDYKFESFVDISITATIEYLAHYTISDVIEDSSKIVEMVCVGNSIEQLGWNLSILAQTINCEISAWDAVIIADLGNTIITWALGRLEGKHEEQPNSKLLASKWVNELIG
jgi:hypothetical protein